MVRIAAMAPESLPRDELARRIVALRTLRGLEQTQLAQLVAADGLGKHDVGRLEREDARLPLSPSHRRSLAHHLGVSEDWFTERDLARVLGSPGGDSLADLTARLAALEELLREHDDRARQATENIRRIAAGQESREAILDLADDALRAAGMDPSEPAGESDTERARAPRDQSNPEQGRQ